MKKPFAAAFVVSTCAIAGSLIVAAGPRFTPVAHSSGGITGYSGITPAGPGNYVYCQSCHFGPDPTATVAFSDSAGAVIASQVGTVPQPGAGSLSLYAGQSAVLRYALSTPAAASFGVNIASNGGTFTESEGGLSITNGEIHHTAGGRKAVPSGGTGYYTFTYTQTASNDTSSSYVIAGACAWGGTSSGKTAMVRLTVNGLRPADPTGLAGGAASSTSIPLTWSGSGPAYRVIARPDGYATSATDTGGALVYDVETDNIPATGLMSSTTYYFRVWGRATYSGIHTFSYASTQTVATTTAAPVICSVELSPSFANFSSNAATGAVQVISACDWTATITAGSFVTITSALSGSGAGSLAFSVAANQGAASRTTTITVGTKAFEVTQSGAGIATIALTAAASPFAVALTWNSIPEAISFEVYRTSGGGASSLLTSTGAASFNDTTVTAGTGYLYRIRVLGTGGWITSSNVDLAVPFDYSRASLTAGTSLIEAADLTELREAAAAARAALRWTLMSFTDAPLAAAVVKRIHVVELRSAIDGVRAGVGLPPFAWADPAITSGTTIVRAAHVMDMREGLR